MKVKMILPALTEALSPYCSSTSTTRLGPGEDTWPVCDFCYKVAFFEGGRGFYTQRVDAALAEIDRLPGRHLYFLDDHSSDEDDDSVFDRTAGWAIAHGVETATFHAAEMDVA